MTASRSCSFWDSVGTIDIARAKTNLGLKNLVYNLNRLVVLEAQAIVTEIAE